MSRNVCQLFISKGESYDPNRLRITTELEPGNKDRQWWSLKGQPRSKLTLCKGYDIISETGTEAAPQPGTIIQTSNLYRLAIQYVRQVKQQILTKLISWPLSSAIVSLLDQKMVIICGYVIRRWHHSRHKQFINLVLSHLATLACQKSSPKGSHPWTLAVHSWIFTTWVSNASNK